MGVVLGQRENQSSYSIYFVSKNLTHAYTKKYILVVVHDINKFRHYITDYETFVHTGHSSIKFLMNKPNTNGRITRWLLLLEEFNITILDRPRRENLVFDFLSRINNDNGDPIHVDDSFKYESLFLV